MAGSRVRMTLWPDVGVMSRRWSGWGRCVDSRALFVVGGAGLSMPVESAGSSRSSHPTATRPARRTSPHCRARTKGQ